MYNFFIRYLARSHRLFFAMFCHSGKKASDHTICAPCTCTVPVTVTHCHCQHTFPLWLQRVDVYVKQYSRHREAISYDALCLDFDDGITHSDYVS